MEKYKSLLGKNINLEFNGEIINSLTINMISDKPHTIEGVGNAYKCGVNWNNKEIGSTGPRLDFDEKTLNDLTTNKIAHSPVMNGVCFKVTE